MFSDTAAVERKEEGVWVSLMKVLYCMVLKSVRYHLCWG